MQRTNTVLLTPTCEQDQQLRSLAEASARLWNMANYEQRQEIFKSLRTVKSMLRNLYDRLEAHGVTDLIIGDLKHIRDNANHGKLGNRKLHNFWPFVQIRQRIRELGEEYGIRVRFKSERGTSKHCSLCGERHKNGRKRRGLYHCKTHNLFMNADVNGAYNILYRRRKVTAGGGSRPMAWPMLLKWNTQEWRVSAA